MTSIDVSSNNLSIEGKTALGKILEESINLQHMTCDEWSITPGATALDLSEKQLDAGDGVLIGNVVKRNRALSSLKLKPGLAMTADMTTADLRDKRLGASAAMIVAAFLPKCL